MSIRCARTGQASRKGTAGTGDGGGYHHLDAVGEEARAEAAREEADDALLGDDLLRRLRVRDRHLRRHDTTRLWGRLRDGGGAGDAAGRSLRAALLARWRQRRGRGRDVAADAVICRVLLARGGRPPPVAS